MMSKPVFATSVHGQVLYFHIWVGTQVFNTSTGLLENFNPANWGNYSIPLPEQNASGVYLASYPSQLAAGTLSYEVIYTQAGNGPQISDAAGGPANIQSQGVNVAQINGVGQAAISLALSAGTMVAGLIAGGAATVTSFPTTLASPINGQYVGRVLLFTSGNNLGAVSAVMNYSGSTRVITGSSVPQAPANGDGFIIV